MADVKWIKITTDIFDDEKILLIESLPDADAIIVIWFKLLCLAGKNNNSGVFMLNDKVAYTEKMLATIFRRKEATVKLALDTFQEFGMIEIIDDVITIPNWGKHQNLDQLETKREYMRGYMNDYRQKQRQIAVKTGCKTNSKTNSKTNVRQADIDKDKDKELDKDKDTEKDCIDKLPKNKNIPYKEKIGVYSGSDEPTPSEPKHKHGEYGRVLLTDKEYNRLIQDYGQDMTDRAITFFDVYIAEKGYKSKSHNLAMRRWVFDAIKERDQKRGQKNGTAEQLDQFYDMMTDWATESEGQDAKSEN